MFGEGACETTDDHPSTRPEIAPVLAVGDVAAIRHPHSVAVGCSDAARIGDGRHNTGEVQSVPGRRLDRAALKISEGEVARLEHLSGDASAIGENPAGGEVNRLGRPAESSRNWRTVAMSPLPALTA